MLAEITEYVLLWFTLCCYFKKAKKKTFSIYIFFYLECLSLHGIFLGAFFCLFVVSEETKNRASSERMIRTERSPDADIKNP